MPAALVLMTAGSRAQQQNSATATCLLNGEGPVFTQVLSPGQLDLTVTGQPNRAFMLLSGAYSPGTLVVAGLGSVDIAMNASFNVVLNGVNPASLLDAIANTGPSGTFIFNTALGGGLQTGFQFPAFQAAVVDATSPSGFRLTACVKPVVSDVRTGTFAFGAGRTSVRFPFCAFAFPFMGSARTDVYVNVHGNLTFTGPSAASSGTSSTLQSGPPRIAHFWTPIDPAQAQVSYVETAAYVSFTTNARAAQNANGTLADIVTLHADGRIDVVYDEVPVAASVVGITSGSTAGALPWDLTAGFGSASGPTIFQAFSGSPNPNPTKALISEIQATNGNNAVEIANYGPAAIDLSGYSLVTGNSSSTHTFVFPAGTILNGEDTIVVRGTNGANTNHTFFAGGTLGLNTGGLLGGSASAALKNAAGAVVDAIGYNSLGLGGILGSLNIPVVSTLIPTSSLNLSRIAKIDTDTAADFVLQAANLLSFHPTLGVTGSFDLEQNALAFVPSTTDYALGRGALRILATRAPSVADVLGNDATASVPLAGMTFPFYGQSYTEVYVNSNGSLSFGSGDTSASALATAFASGVPKVAGLWKDLNPAIDGFIGVYQGGGVVHATFHGVAVAGGPDLDGVAFSFDPSGTIAVVVTKAGPQGSLMGISSGGNLGNSTNTDFPAAFATSGFFLGGPNQNLFQVFPAATPLVARPLVFVPKAGGAYCVE